MILPGFVKKVMSYGVFVEFSTGIFGLAPNSVSTLAVLRKTIVALYTYTHKEKQDVNRD